MKYKYSKLAFGFCLILVEGVVLTLLLVFGNLIGAEKKQFNNMFLLVSVFLVSCAFMYIGEYSNKYVNFLDDYIHFNSFRFKMKVNPMSLKVKYEDVYSIKPRKLPIVGVWAIKINAKNLPHEITISFCFKKHKELFENLCTLVKKYKPDAYIDKELSKYTQI